MRDRPQKLLAARHLDPAYLGVGGAKRCRAAVEARDRPAIELPQ
jgi:hypothetical protein